MSNTELTYGFSVDGVREALGADRGKTAGSFFPQVRAALARLDAGDVAGAGTLLAEFLGGRRE